MRNSKKFLYHQVYEYILQLYLDGAIRPGEKAPTETNLAATLGTSRVSIRAGYQLLEQEKIIFRSQGSGTFLSTDLELLNRAASALSLSSKSQLIGVIAPELDYFFPKVLKGVEQEAHENHYSVNVAINSSQQKEKEAIEKLIVSKADGVLFTPNRSYDCLPHLEMLQKNNIPYVMIGKPYVRIRANAVYTDDISTVYTAISEIKSKGYKNVIHITNKNADLEAVVQRRQGFMLGMQEFFKQENPTVIDVCDEDFENQLIHSLDKRTAIYLVEDLLARQVISLVKSQGFSIPTDIGILGTNNTLLCEQLEIGLSSISHSQEEEGKIAFQMLHEQINSKGDPSCPVKHFILDGKVVWRDSL